MKRIPLLSLAIITASCAHIATVEMNLKSHEVIPISILAGELESCQFLIPAQFDGRIENFQLDTGSSYTSVSNTAITSSYSVSGSMNRTSAAGKSKADDKIKIRNFSLGSIEKSDFEVVRYKADANQTNRLGMDVLSARPFNLNFRTQEMLLDAVVPSHLKRFPLTVYVGNTFGFPVLIESELVDALWDTGAELSVVDRDFVAAHPTAFKFVQKIDNGTDATGHSVEFDLLEVSGLRIGERPVHGKIMAMDFKMVREKLGPQIKVLIGTNLIRVNDWYFDLANRQWSVD